ncbi:hypothetical protein DB347_23135 [Opitutaceae bacterium EW11]|nr:hypothetical protein DB347_23135 [Opitutaceae bacterium EW11]
MAALESSGPAGIEPHVADRIPVLRTGPKTAQPGTILRRVALASGTIRPAPRTQTAPKAAFATARRRQRNRSLAATG